MDLCISINIKTIFLLLILLVDTNLNFELINAISYFYKLI